MSELASIQPKTLRATPQQWAAMAITEQCIALLDWTALQAKGTPLAVALAQASDVLKKAHEGFVASLTSTVSIAAPAEIAKLVQP